MPLCAVCPTETDQTCSGGCGTVFCSDECKQLVWDDAHEFLCAAANPETCYLPPLNRRERKAWLDLLEGRMEMFPNARTDEKAVEQIEQKREICGGNWEVRFPLPPDAPLTPLAEAARSFDLAFVRSLLWSERSRWHLTLFDRRCEIWTMVSFMSTAMARTIDGICPDLRPQDEAGSPDPFPAQPSPTPSRA
ncbi:hypothetical protein JCM6882_005822 [Rhodosporidiobolus microsporus]